MSPPRAAVGSVAIGGAVRGLGTGIARGMVRGLAGGVLGKPRRGALRVWSRVLGAGLGSTAVGTAGVAHEGRLAGSRPVDMTLG